MKIFIPGHKGYVGSALVPKLESLGYEVAGLDIIDGVDVRDIGAVSKALKGCGAVIHLACLSNDPTSDLDPVLTKSINYDSFRPLVRAAKDAGIRRFIFASSSAVYGVKQVENVTEDLPLEPITDYARYKAMCEEVLHEERQPGFETVIIRPATVCGFSPNLRLDLCVHILTMAALRKGVISVFGGNQYRPNIHISDIVDAYIKVLEAETEQVDGQIYNVGHQNLTIKETAELVSYIIPAEIICTESSDPRSYHVSAEKFKKAFGWEPKKTVCDAVRELCSAYRFGNIPNPDDDRYYRVRSIKKMDLK